MNLTDITGKQVEIKQCLGCEIANGTLNVFGGILYESHHFAIAQDFELPIDGFFIIFSKRHVEKFNDLSPQEQCELTLLVNKTLNILEKNVAAEYNIILEEKAGYHFHVWLMPRHKWMIAKFGKVLKNLNAIQDYALNNLKTQENFQKIKNTCDLVKKEINK